MNRALLDTDILSYFLKGDPMVVKKVEDYLGFFEFLEVSIISYYEITSGLLAKSAFKQLEVFEEFIAENAIIPVTSKSAKISALIYSNLRQSGNPISLAAFCMAPLHKLELLLLCLLFF